MKKTLLTVAALTVAASAAFAGGLDEPEIEMAPVEIIEDTTAGSSAGGLIVPLIIVALIAAAVASSD